MIISVSVFEKKPLELSLAKLKPNSSEAGTLVHCRHVDCRSAYKTCVLCIAV